MQIINEVKNRGVDNQHIILLNLANKSGEEIAARIKFERPGDSVKVPEYSHNENRIYVILQEGKLKHISFYNGNHELLKSIYFQHYHDGKKPHVQYDVHHKGAVTVPNESDNVVIGQVHKWLIEHGYKGVL